MNHIQKVIEDRLKEFDEIFNHNPDRFYDNLKSHLSTTISNLLSAIEKEVDGKKGLLHNPDYFIELKRRLNGNIAMKGVDDFQLTQIGWVAQDLALEDIQTLLKSAKEQIK